MPIVSDTKDWTWVLERPCPDCGFAAGDVPATAVAGLIRENAAAWPALLRAPAPAAVRPSDDRWSALEYACHVRDVFRQFHRRLHLLLHDDAPTFADWDQDAAAVRERYDRQDLDTVARDLVAAGETLAAAFEAVRDDQWQRPGARSDGARFTVETLARYLIHDPVHHIWDVEQGYAALTSRDV